jgi:hypothetical protein
VYFLVEIISKLRSGWQTQYTVSNCSTTTTAIVVMTLKGGTPQIQNFKKKAGVSTMAALALERVIGLTTLHNCALSSHSSSGEVAYAAGCVVVLYHPKVKSLKS